MTYLSQLSLYILYFITDKVRLFLTTEAYSTSDLIKVLCRETVRSVKNKLECP
jgi:hypothetical protein